MYMTSNITSYNMQHFVKISYLSDFSSVPNPPVYILILFRCFWNLVPVYILSLWFGQFSVSFAVSSCGRDNGALWER